MSADLQLELPISGAEAVKAKRFHVLTAAALEAIGDAVITVDNNGNIDYVNAKAENMLQQSGVELCGRPFAAMVQIVNEHNHEQADTVIAKCFCQQAVCDPNRQLLLRRSDGSSVPIEDFAAPMRMADGRIAGAVIVFKDVTERHHVQQSLNQSNRMFHKLLDFAPDAMLIANLHGDILLANNRAEQMFDYSKQQLAERRLQCLIACESLADVLEGNALQERQCRRSDSSEFTGEVNLRRLDIEQGIRLMAVVRDITQRKYYEHQLSYQASYDSLTGLPNRAAATVHLQQALAQAQANGGNVALMHIDLDHFNTVNNTLGHRVGDQLLQIIANRLQTLRRQGDIIAFLGGDNFVFLLQGGIDKETLEQMAAAILQTIAEPCDINEHLIYLGCSIGISVYPQDGADALEIMRNTETAMYRAKESGRNCYVYFTCDMHHRQLEHLELSTGLREALAHEQFELHFQPKLDLNGMNANSMEALIRWRHPDNGLIPPALFIPVAENCGLIVEIGAWVIEEACCQLALWRLAGLDDIRVAINLSASQCHKDDIFSRITGTLDRYQLPGKCLEVEITESVMLHNPKQALATFRALRDHGVHIAIDDFGTGYSSFSYLKQFPSHLLKIDKSFIDDLAEDAGNVEIVRAIIAVAHCLNMKVVAEGVETVEQLTILQEHGCDEIQGYLFSCPISGEKILDQPWGGRHLTKKIALMNHAQWFGNIIRITQENNRHEINPDAVTNHRHCLLGRWFGTWGKIESGHFQDCAEIEAIHIESHQLADEMLRLRQMGMLERALDLIPKLKNMQQRLEEKLGSAEKAVTLQ